MSGEGLIAAARAFDGTDIAGRFPRPLAMGADGAEGGAASGPSASPLPVIPPSASGELALAALAMNDAGTHDAVIFHGDHCWRISRMAAEKLHRQLGVLLWPLEAERSPATGAAMPADALPEAGRTLPPALFGDAA